MDELADVARVVALIVGAGHLAVTLVVTYTYVRIYRLHRVASRGSEDAWRGLLPRHVFLVGISDGGLVLYSMSTLFSRLGDDVPSWRAPVLLVLYALGLWAMWDVLGHQRYRLYARSHADEVPSRLTLSRWLHRR